MLARLFLLFTVVPAIELYLLIAIGSWIGPAPTILMLIATGIIGAWLARSQGTAVLRQLGEDLQRGVPPAARVVEGLLVLAGALLLLTPGVLTDLFGILLLFPPTRRAIAPQLVRALAEQAARHGATVTLGPTGPGTVSGQGPPSQTRGSAGSPFDHPTA